jgi:periplasmic divalent cation tolerance protein
LSVQAGQQKTRLNRRVFCYIITSVRGVAQLVARTAGGREVAGSSPVTPTILLRYVSMKLITLFLTCADEEEAKKISDKLLDKKLAACVRLTDVKSAFWWQGKKQHADEVQLIIESAEEKFDAIEATVLKLHSYETFVLTAYPVVKASAGVEQWVKGVTG